MEGIKHLRGRIPDMQDTISVLLLALFGLTLLGVLVLVAVPYLEPPPLVYNNIPLPVDGPVHQGDVIPLHVDRCNNLDSPLYLESARTLRSLDTGHLYFLPSGGAVAEPGCSFALVTSSSVPEDAPPGRYQLTAIIRLHGRWGRIFDVPYKSAEFEVIP